MNAARQKSYFVDEEKHFLRTLLYFDIFDYPLTVDEIARYSTAASSFSILPTLDNLVSQKILYQFQNFYTVQNDPKLVPRRMKGNALAEKKMKTAKFFTHIVSLFPFVRAVMLSGSISKGYMDDKSDIDYFIITAENRLWLVRTALALFRRVFLFNSGKSLCTNYFIDTKNLEIKDKNIFTAIEFNTLEPMIGSSVIEDFRSANQWAVSYLPNLRFKKTVINDKNHRIKTLFERILSFQAFDRFNLWLMNKTISYWKRRYGSELDPNDFEVAFRSTIGVSKSHPQFFQKRILARHSLKIREFEIQHGIDLSS